MYENEKYQTMVFLTMNKQQRIEHFGFHTQNDLAEYLNLPYPKLISEWKAHPKFNKDLEKMQVSLVKDDIVDVIDALKVRGIKDGDVSALKELVKIAGLSIERTQNISNDDVQYVIQAVIETAKQVLHTHPDLLHLFASELEKKIGEL